MCTSWKRKEFVFDYCIHNLPGTGGTALKKIWEEHEALKEVEILNYDVFVRIEDSEGNLLNIYTDLDKLERHLKEISPEDSKVIEDYLKASRSMVRADFFAMNMGGISSKLKIIPRAYSLIKWTGTTLEYYAGKFRSEFLAEI